MSQITRCPNCATAFKVVADQLRIAQGWVCCGQCKQVFDASAYLQPAVVAAAQPSTAAVMPQPAAAMAPKPATAMAPQPVAAVAPQPTAAMASQPAAAPPLPKPAKAAHPSLAPRTAPVRARSDAPSVPPKQAAAPLPPPIKKPAASALAPDERPTTARPTRPGEHDIPPEPQPGFVLAARRQAFWRQPVVRAVLLLLIGLAGLGLAVQIVVHERDRIAAIDARARPWLMALCRPLQCTLAPQRQIADVVIDSSSFNKGRGDSYQLALTVKSRAAIPLAMPAVELTLTDIQDQPVLRRVLLPVDLSAPAELAAHGEWSATLPVIVTTGGARVTGYRLLAFYP
ncbi:zinc-ribbon and DUF3426 domain-containing protein [Verminephrobacter eiseniae]|uniref:zinc-ribbon and DUF3426 domain-containing protein n=1 Tax=Verminephrobacter eiseniae TaxID=364317 RepID=UPI00031A27E7|nr:zinc-ribbon and DUF3426 domain-containing protein [Verminephrobacter eiseniae]MCW5282881.1 DUF3426 domain-containing protein [Verminephrobacter eiseniae]MCW5303197.1 DUF3426 domain-containing protein [Verminephrobacter eiseniae]MCW8179207.1 DUF3426 domain-containing protein [Verminephrobacter eiseniae]MCW8189333.1 DUF3426 domain-containing protein [Verminephrobacter eiseniae]